MPHTHQPETLYHHERSETMENESKHTPGDWEVVNDGSLHSVEVVDSAGRSVARVRSLDTGHGWATGRDETERDANARLIAAAPDLLEALRDAVELLRWVNVPQDGVALADRTINAARAALAKAEGGAG